MTSDNEILTLKEICDLLRVHPSTIYKLIREGKIACFRIASEWRFRKEVIVHWLDEKSIQSQQIRGTVDQGD